MEQTATVKERITAIIADKLGLADASEVTPEATIQGDLGADSLDVVELIMEVEKEFNISIPDEKAEEMSTVGEIVAYVEKNKVGY
jgi:acyl carrier protein